jgi:nucleoside-diphosphate-sugar epimerase
MASLVCVTGASGTVGSWVVKALSEAGLAVRACVRDPASAKINFLRAIPNVELFHLDDVQNSAALEQAFHGCTSVCHVANPMPFGNQNHDPEW